MSHIPARTISAPNGGAAPFRTSYGASPAIAHNADAKPRGPPPAIPTPAPAPNAWRPKVASPITSDAPSTLSPPPTTAASPVTAAAAATVVSPTSPNPQPQPQPQPQPERSSGGDMPVRTLEQLDANWAHWMATATNEAGEAMMDWAKQMWENLNKDGDLKPTHLFEGRRDLGIFGGQPAAQAKRHLLVKERTLPHQVMGILSRVTPDNYDVIQQELLNLPIRQSEDGEITEIVNVFFKKAIRPEDSIYAPQYAKLIRALVYHIEGIEREKESERGVSKVIRSAIVNKCKDQYDNLPELKQLQQQVEATDDPETEGRRRDMMIRLKANIGFLGQLFVHSLINERVVVFVLYSLLWGSTSESSQSRSEISDYEVEQFFTLLEVCGPRLGQNSKDTYQSSYLDTLGEIANGHFRCSSRCKFLAMDCRDFIMNDYQHRNKSKRQGPMKLDDYNRQAAEQQVRDFELVNQTLKMQQQQHQQQQQQQQLHANHPGSVLRNPNRKVPVGSPTGQAPPPNGPYRPLGGAQQQQAPVQQQQQVPQEMTQQDFVRAMDDTAKKGKPIPAEIKGIPPNTLVAYFVAWASRPLGSAKYLDDRKAAANVIRMARDMGALNRAQIAQLTVDIIHHAIHEEDIPKIYEFLVDFFEADREIFGYPAFNTLLREVCTFTPTVSFEVLKRVVSAVTRERAENAPAATAASSSKIATPIAAGVVDFPGNNSSSTRVHLLPHLLRFVGYTSSDPKPKRAADNDDDDDEADEEEDERLVTERENYDVLEYISHHTADTETPFLAGGDPELAVYISLLSNIAVNEDGIDMPSGKDPKQKIVALFPEEVKYEHLKNITVARKVLSAAFIFARYNKKLMEALINVFAKPILDGKSAAHTTALFLEVYETWVEVDRKPAAALDSCLELLFANAPTALLSSSTAATLFEEISKNGDEHAIPNTRAKIKK